MKVESLGEATGDAVALLGRPSATRTEWEVVREADAHDLNARLDSGKPIDVYLVPLWSNAEIERSLRELEGFDEARVFVELRPTNDRYDAWPTLADFEWAGAASTSGDLQGTADLIYVCAGLDIPMAIGGFGRAETRSAVALAIQEDLTQEEIGAILRGDPSWLANADSLDHADELLVWLDMDPV